MGVDEASAWLVRGGNVQLFCEAIPWPEEPPAGNVLAAYKRRRSFAASSGQLPIRVIVSLMATFEAACPNLLPDLRCGIYEERPRACRVYPAEVNPFIPLDRAGKLCPPESWQADDVLQDESGAWADSEVDGAITGMRETDATDAAVKARLCAWLDLSSAGLSNEGVVVVDLPRDRLIEALASAKAGDGRGLASASDWRFVSHRQGTLALLASAATSTLEASALTGAGMSFMAFVPGDAG